MLKIFFVSGFVDFDRRLEEIVTDPMGWYAPLSVRTIDGRLSWVNDWDGIYKILGVTEEGEMDVVYMANEEECHQFLEGGNCPFQKGTVYRVEADIDTFEGPTALEDYYAALRNMTLLAEINTDLNAAEDAVWNAGLMPRNGLRDTRRQIAFAL